MNVEYAGVSESPPIDNAALKTAPDWSPELTQKRNLYDAAFQHMPSPALIIDCYLVVACNNAASALFGLSPSNVVGREWWRLIRLTDQATHPRSGAPASLERTHACVVRVSTGDRPAQVRAVPLDPGEATSAQLLVISLSEDAPPTNSPDAQGSFLLDVAHELRSPLQSFNLALAGLAEGGATLGEDGHRRLVSAAQRSAIHLQMLVENLLDAASLGANQFGVRATETDIADVMQEAGLVVEPLLRLNEQSIVVETPDDLPLVQGDGQRLRQVLINLLHNAVKYGPRRQPIALRACSLGTVVLIQVTDRGAGIPAADQSRLFERRFRGSSASGAGNGLGLGISRAIVEQHGGHIGVRSAPGYGTTFWFTLPAA